MEASTIFNCELTRTTCDFSPNFTLQETYTFQLASLTNRVGLLGTAMVVVTSVYELIPNSKFWPKLAIKTSFHTSISRFGPLPNGIVLRVWNVVKSATATHPFWTKNRYWFLSELASTLTNQASLVEVLGQCAKRFKLVWIYHFYLLTLVYYDDFIAIRLRVSLHNIILWE